MPNKITNLSIARNLAVAVFGRKTRQGKINKAIDAFLEDKPLCDSAAYFLNEVLIHKHPRQFKANTMRYTIKPFLRRKLKL